MSIINRVKQAAKTVTNVVSGCDVCPPNSGGIPGGCQCDFLDVTSPTTADFQKWPSSKS